MRNLLFGLRTYGTTIWDPESRSYVFRNGQNIWEQSDFYAARRNAPPMPVEKIEPTAVRTSAGRKFPQAKKTNA